MLIFLKFMQWIFRAGVREGARRVECQGCELLTCFSCGAPHHAPTDCATIRLWLTKCADDSETANYISAHTKVKLHIQFSRAGSDYRICRIKSIPLVYNFF